MQEELKSKILRVNRRLYESGVDVTQLVSSLISNYEHGMEASKKCEIAWVLDEVESFGKNSEKIHDMLDEALKKGKIGRNLWFEAKSVISEMERNFPKNIAKNMARTCGCRFVLPPWLKDWD